MFDIKRYGEKKKNVPLLKLIQDPWSIKTVISQFQCDPFPKSLDLPGYDTSHLIRPEGRNARN